MQNISQNDVLVSVLYQEDTLLKKRGPISIPVVPCCGCQTVYSYFSLTRLVIA